MYAHQGTLGGHPIQNSGVRLIQSSAQPMQQQHMQTQGVSPVVMNGQAVNDGYRVLPQARDQIEFVSERENQIRMQAARVQKLEERIQMLHEESAKQDQVVSFKQNESVQWQESYNQLRDEFLIKSSEMSSYEEEIDEMLRKQMQILAEIEHNETTIRNYHNDIYGRNEDIQYWQERAKQQVQTQQQLTQLEQQIEIVQQENVKLNKLLLQHPDYQKKKGMKERAKPLLFDE